MWKKLLFANLLFAAAVFVVLDSLFGVTAARGERITVPDFRGATEETIAADGRFAVTAEYRYDESPAGTILSQEPAPGSVRKIGEDRKKCELRVVVSMGLETVALPDVVGKNAKVAAAELRNAGFSVELLTDPTAAVHASGIVTRIDPVAGSVLQVGERVTLWVSPGSADTGYED